MARRRPHYLRPFAFFVAKDAFSGGFAASNKHTIRCTSICHDDIASGGATVVPSSGLNRATKEGLKRKEELASK